MKLIKKLQECSTIGQADPILTKLGAGPAVKKLVETAIILNNSQDPQQRTHAYSFMESAIRELENDDDDKLHEESMGQHSGEDGLPTKPIGAEGNSPDSKVMTEEDDKDDDENKVKEEVLDNHNNGPREDGSEQSTDNTAPYPGKGVDTTTGEKPMQDMDGAVNQWNETGGMPPNGGGMPQNGGMPPNGGMPGGGSMMMPGLSPDIAQEMGMIMPQLPPMDTNQMMKQMQYTVENLYKKEIAPLHRIIKQEREARIHSNRQLKEVQTQQREVIKNLSQELQETKASSGNLKLDLDSMRRNAPATFRETTVNENVMPTFDSSGMPGIQPINRSQVKLTTARSEIEQMDKILNSKSKSIYQ